ncbi:MAG: RagB/SusD family nutrient uptake outer membrane protein [Bacteroidales bacterium]|nr:RagB/SusD family nutrient uptake outer membrane protein [Bacteroidales bacterium]
MKKYIYLIAMVLTVAACDLDETPKAKVGKDALFASESGLAMYCNSFYNWLPGSSLATWGDTNNNYINANFSISTFFRSSYNASQEGSWSWGTLRNINYFLDNNNNPALSEAVRNNYTGIARFWRAVFYFDKIRSYGDVPWIDHTLDVDDELLTAPRDPRGNVAEKIFEDLDFASKNISSDFNSTATVVTSLVAAGFQSRFCLWEGTFRKYHGEADADKWLQRAADAADKVIKSGKFSIYNNGAKPYRELFVTSTPIATETMLATVYSAAEGIQNTENRKSTVSSLGVTFSPIRQFMNLYLKLDGSRYTDDPTYKTQQFFEEFEGRDKRIGQIIRVPGTTRSEGPVFPDFGVTYTGYQGLKFCTDIVANDGSNTGEQNYVWMRYAEILLNYAEAKAELGTLTDADWALSVGAIRARGGITGGLTTKPTELDPYMKENFFKNVSDPVIMEVRRERMCELVWEDTPSAFSDLQRWKEGPLLGMKWQGIYVKDFDTDIDLDLDGTPDAHFYTGAKPSAQGHIVYTYVQLAPDASGKYDTRWGVDTDGHTLLLDMQQEPIVWNDRCYFHPISVNDIAMNPNLTQNPGW